MNLAASAQNSFVALKDDVTFSQIILAVDI